MILPILPRFVVDLKSIDSGSYNYVYFTMSLGISSVKCFCTAIAFKDNAVVSPSSDPQDDKDVDFDSLKVSNEYDKETAVEIECSTEDHLIGLTIGLTDEQVEAINMILNEQFLDKFIGA